MRREDLRDRFIHLSGKRPRDRDHADAGRCRLRGSAAISDAISHQCHVWHFVSIGLYLIGVPNAILWGILATTLRFIPYIGPWIAAAMPIGLSMAISPGWIAPLLTVGLFVVLELFWTISWNPGSTARTPACRRWRSWWRLCFGCGCGDPSGYCWRPR